MEAYAGWQGKNRSASGIKGLTMSRIFALITGPTWRMRRNPASESERCDVQKSISEFISGLSLNMRDHKPTKTTSEAYYVDTTPSISFDQYELSVQLLALEFPNGEFENWEKCLQLLSYAHRLYTERCFFPSTSGSTRAWAEILSNIAWYSWTTGDYTTAQSTICEALNLCEKAEGLSKEQMLIKLEILAGILLSQNKYLEAEQANRLALQGFRNTLGRCHPSTLTSISNLALILDRQGRYEESEKLSRQAIKESAKRLGKRNIDTIKSVSNLALVLQHQGKYKEATKLSRQVVDEFLKMLGLHHPSTLTSMNNLATLLGCQGRQQEAESLNCQALEGKIRVLGVNHPSTLTSMGNWLHLRMK